MVSLGQSGWSLAQGHSYCCSQSMAGSRRGEGCASKGWEGISPSSGTLRDTHVGQFQFPHRMGPPQSSQTADMRAQGSKSMSGGGSCATLSTQPWEPHSITITIPITCDCHTIPTISSGHTETLPLMGGVENNFYLFKFFMV